ncbi:hypothetical protein KOW79_002930 [Hemibagrus wyckioides]|uniref:Uncharacterized protein n=1 Tax=Hemibagrus wyckioides TaxID=337641 RepID=A0A9D3P4J2_9TELE|nr:hypothetical protein KOW79_002930 [Hemibagrus wyckioides]
MDITDSLKRLKPRRKLKDRALQRAGHYTSETWACANLAFELALAKCHANLVKRVLVPAQQLLCFSTLSRHRGNAGLLRHAGTELAERRVAAITLSGVYAAGANSRGFYLLCGKTAGAHICVFLRVLQEETEDKEGEVRDNGGPVLTDDRNKKEKEKGPLKDQRCADSRVFASTAAPSG